jgi:hypothetical protein
MTSLFSGKKFIDFPSGKSDFSASFLPRRSNKKNHPEKPKKAAIHRLQPAVHHQLNANIKARNIS